MVAIKVFRVDSIPSNINYKLLINSALNEQFMIYHDLSESETLMLATSELVASLHNSIPGLSVSEKYKSFNLSSMRYLSIYTKNNQQPLWDIYNILKGHSSGLFVSFCPSNYKHVKKTKDRIADFMSREEIRVTKSIIPLDKRSSGSIQSDLYYGYDSRMANTSLLEMLSESLFLNGTSYKAAMIIESYSDEHLFTYLKSKLKVIYQCEIHPMWIEKLWKIAIDKDAIPFSQEASSSLLSFSESTIKELVINSPAKISKAGIFIGTRMLGGVSETNDNICIPIPTLNLGVIITGVPGTGKTFAAMNIVEQVLRAGMRNIAVISPTSEWGNIASECGMNLVRISDPALSLNLFGCSDANVSRFYENLAMLIANSCNAGPYTNPLEKCLLSAFHKCYSEALDPDPTELYEQIEEAIIEQHGKRSNAGVKYTKHGENIRSALESIRLLIMKRQFAYNGGTKIKDLLKNGVIFDLSGASNSTKPLFYSLILNQIYSYAEQFDELGDGALRMLICAEEAHLVFGKAKKSAPSVDLGQRMQDFRKRGICMMLVTHNVTDIDDTLRRLCQIKMYFRQNSDIAKYAANDLIFSEKDFTEVADKLKTLGQRICALNHINQIGTSKNPTSSIFMKASEQNHTQAPVPSLANNESRNKTTIVSLFKADGSPAACFKAEVRYVHEVLFSGYTDEAGHIKSNAILDGKKCELIIYGEKRKDNRLFYIIGGEESIIKLNC